MSAESASAGRDRLAARLAEAGTPLSLTTRSFTLEDPASAYLLLKGTAEVFSARRVEGPAGEEEWIDRRHVLTARAGSLLLGLGAAQGEGRTALVVQADPGCSVLRVPAAAWWEAASSPEHEAAAAEALDGWLAALVAGLPPPDALVPMHVERLAPGAEGQTPAGASLRAEYEAVWITVLEGEARLLGDPHFAVAAGEAAPLVGRAWLRAQAPLRWRAEGSPSCLRRKAAAAAIAAWHDRVLRYLAVQRSAEGERDAARRVAKAEAEGATVGAAFARLAATIGDEASPSAASPGQPLHAAVSLICGALGAEGPGSATAGSRSVAAIAESAHLRARRVALQDRWWQADHGPLLVFRSEGQAPLAALPTGPAAYALHDPATGRSAPVDAAAAQALDGFGYTFLRRLPDRALGGRDLLRLGFDGCRRDLAVLLGLGAAGGLLGLVVPMATGLIFDRVIPGAQRAQLLHVVLGLLVAMLAETAFEVARGLAILRVNGRISASLQGAIWDRLVDLPASFFRGYSSGDLASRAFGIDEIFSALSTTAVTAVMGSVFGLFSAGLLFAYDPRLALVACGLVGVAVLVTVAVGVRQLRAQRPLAEMQGRLSGLVFELLKGVAKLRMAGAEDRGFAQWAQRFADQRALALATRAPLLVFNGVFPLLAMMTIYAGLIGGEQRGMATGAFIAFVAAYQTFLSSTLAASRAGLTLLAIGPRWERLRPILETAPEIATAKADPGRLTGAIELAHVSFRYRADGPPVLDDVSLKIAPGSFVAIVGPSGSGKSTLLRLLLGFEKPEGSIYFDGQDLAGLDLRRVRRQIGVVLQNGRLFGGSLLHNIIGASSLTKDDALRAARTAGLDRDLADMPMGLHTMIDEGGTTLSGGQRQRLMIARALVRQPRILFFDEATSALDNETQRAVSQSIDRLQVTRVVIAHRLSTIAQADRIFVLDRGRLVQQGTYRELVAQTGPFATLAARQIA